MLLQTPQESKKSKMYICDGQYHSQMRELTSSEESFLDAFLKALYKINPSLHNNLSHMKRNWYLYLVIRMGCIYKC